jgi:tetratricopeptide (TPR) repeat protein
LVAALVREDSAVLRTGFAGLLAAELDLVTPARRPCVVAFVDATERLSETGMAMLNGIVWQLPHVLWVLTGRDWLRWADDTNRDIPFYGATRWPGLAAAPGGGTTGEPRQHLVGNLSDDDATAFLRSAISLGGLELTDAQISLVVRESDGLPLWLDIAVQIVRHASTDGRPVRNAELTGPFDDLVRRLLRDLAPDEQRIVRAACLVSRFDTDLVAAGAGVDAGAAARLVNRSMIIHNGVTPRLPFRLHDEVRRVVRTAGPSVPGGWTESDWRAAGARIVHLLRDRHDTLDDGLARLDLLDQVLEVGLTSDVSVDWLGAAVAKLPSMYAFAERHPAEFADPRNWAEWFCTLMSGWRPGSNAAQRRDHLRAFITRRTPPDLLIMAQRHLGYSLRAIGEYQESIAIFENLVAADPIQQHRFHLAHTLERACRFDEALELLDTWPDLDPTSVATIHGGIAYAHGRLTEDVDLKQARIAKYRAERRYRLLAEVDSHVMFCRALLATGHESEALRKADEAEEHRHPDALRTYLAAAAVSCAGDPDRVRHHVERARAACDWFGLSTDTYKTILPLVFDAVVRRDNTAIEQAHALVLARHRRLARTWRGVGFWLAAAGAPVPEPDVAWLEDAAVVRDRWNALVDTRRAELGLN